MEYLFFDIECANCFDGKGKICSFGFVRTDTSFTVLQKEDWIINPRARFYLAGRKGAEDLTLAYPQSRFRRAPSFPSFYEQIRDLLCAPDQIVVGHAVSNDVKFLLDECERYHLPPFDYAFFDSQKLYREYKQIANQVALEKILADFNLTPTVLHKSDDDALMTMWATRELCRAYGQSLETVIDEHPRCGGVVAEGEMRLGDAKKYSEVENNRLQNSNLSMFLGFLDALRAQKPSVISEVSGHKVCLPHAFVREHFRQMVLLCRALADHGACYVRHAHSASLLVDVDNHIISATEEGQVHISLEKLLSILQIDVDAFEKGVIDVDAIFTSVHAKKRTLRKHRRKPVQKKPSAPKESAASEPQLSVVP